MSEADIEGKVCDWAEAHGILSIKFTPRGSVGWPDHIFIVPPHGTHVWIEFKAPGEEPTAIQYHRIDCINRKGGNAYWAASVKDGVNILLTILDNAYANE